MSIDIFEQKYRELEQLYNGQKYTEAVAFGEKMLREIPIPPIRKFFVYALMGNAAFITSDWQAGRKYTELALKSPEDANIREYKRQVQSGLLVYMHYFPDITDREMIAAAWDYGKLCADREQFTHDRHRRHGKLKIGYLSTDFFEHIVTNFTIQLYSAYDRDRFEVHLYHIGNTNNEVTDWISGMTDGWHDLRGRGSRDAAEAIYKDNIDILVDLSGHTMGGRTLLISSYKPAPVQVTGIGYWNTTGLPPIDYFLSDRYCAPAENDALFTEKLIRLPHTHFCYTPPESVLACDFTYHLHDPVVFGSFNNFDKLNDHILSLWLRIIRGVPGSRLLLKNVKHSEERLLKMRKRLLKLGFRKEEFELRQGSRPYLQEYADMDIALDTFPYTGGGTTCEALYMGVPVVSLYGIRHGSRFGYSLLSNIGIGELTAASDDEYVEKAVALANSPELLRGLHSQLRRMMQSSPVMDVNNYLREVQQVYMDIYTRWEEKHR